MQRGDYMATVRTRKRGSTYTYIFEAGKKPDGRRNTITKGGYTTKDEAYQAGIMAYNAWKHGYACTDIKSVSFRDFAQVWLEKEKLHIRPSTHRIYTAFADRLIFFLAEKPICDITPMDCEKMIDQLAKQGYSQGYIKSIKKTMSRIMDYAIYPHQLITSNPMKLIPVPRSAKKHAVERVIITPGLFNVLTEKYPYGDVMHIFLHIAYHTGMRLSEVLGLTWDNIDIPRHSIHVCMQLINLEGTGEILTGDLKTPSSYRDIFIDNELAGLLEKWKQDQELNRIINGGAYFEYYATKKGSLEKASAALLPKGAKRIDFVCTNETGYRLSRFYVFKELKTQNLNSHSFRHTHATMLLEAGAPLKGISGRLGHKGNAITNDLYIHNTEHIQEATARIFEQFIDRK